MLRLFRWLSGMPLVLMHGVGAGLGWVVYLASPTYRRRLGDNVRQAGFDASTQGAAVAHAGRMVAELPYLWLRPRDEPLGPRLEWIDEDRSIERALHAGRGVVLMTPHIGAFEVAAQAYAERHGAQHPMTAMYRPARQAWLRELQLTARDRPGLLTAPASLAGIRQMMKALRRGDAVGLLPDQVPPEGMGVWAPYFGREAYTMTLAARLAQQTGATPLLMLAQRLPRGRGFAVHTLPWPEPLPAMPGREAAAVDVADAPEAADARTMEAHHHRASAEVVNRAMESLVRRHPEQYLWGYNRYKPPRRVAGTTGLESGEVGGAPPSRASTDDTAGR
jgi:Kdo2-lipid IVA lauroyltransferase/acyltransferase